jgi:hypothetical protein
MCVCDLQELRILAYGNAPFHTFLPLRSSSLFLCLVCGSEIGYGPDRQRRQVQATLPAMQMESHRQRCFSRPDLLIYPAT